MKKEFFVLGLGIILLVIVGITSSGLNQSANQFAAVDPNIKTQSTQLVAGRVLSPSNPPQLRYQVADLGTFPQFWSSQKLEAKSINNEGVVFGEVRPWSNGNPRPFKWENGSLHLLSVPPSFNPLWNRVYVEDASDSDQPVGFVVPAFNSPDSTWAGLIWSDESPQIFEDLLWYGSSDDGSFLTGFRTTGSNLGVVYSQNNNQFLDIEVPEGAYASRGRAVNSLGQVACLTYDSVSGLPSGCLWENGALTTLNSLGGDVTEPEDINNLGHIVGWSTLVDGREGAVLWKNGATKNLQDISSQTYSSRAFGINDRDEIVGVSDGAAVLWREETPFNLNDLIPTNSSWSWLTEAVDINESGQIIGNGILATGQQRAFLMTPITP